MDTYFIYGLYDSGFPREIRYVGQTESLVRRFKSHTIAKEWFGPAGIWRHGVRFFGRSVEIAIIDVVRGTRDEAIACERFHIKRLDTGRLVNGVEYNRRCVAAGISSRLRDVYRSGLATIFCGCRNLNSKTHRVLAREFSDIVDKLESEFPTMALWGPRDCFFYRVQKKIRKWHCKAR